MKIEHDGETVATVKKTLIGRCAIGTRSRSRRRQDMPGEGQLHDHEYKIERDGDTVAEVSKRWFRVRDSYGIEVAPGQEDAADPRRTVCIDQMTRG